MLQSFANIININKAELDAWYIDKLSKAARCFYSSVDIRYSGQKMVPVDTNLFPAGFNNLNQNNIIKATKFTQNYFKLNFSKAKNILLIGEDHNRNLHYLDNLKTLENIINQAGYVCKLGSLSANDIVVYNGAMHSDITIYPLIKEHRKLKTIDSFIPDLILLNNDLIAGIPEKLNDIDQEIIPNTKNGWFKRRKFNHFLIYNQLAKELELKFSLPSFPITTEIAVCGGINFKTGEGLNLLAEKTQKTLDIIKEKYKANDIKDDPYVVIKSDYGSYGMGVMMIKSAEDVLSLNQKYRRKMHVTKSNIVNDQVLIQEGVKTIDRINEYMAEPLLYMLDHNQVSFLYRTHKEKDEYSNLNSVGMKIFNQEVSSNDIYKQCCDFIARLATLAAANEV